MKSQTNSTVSSLRMLLGVLALSVMVVFPSTVKAADLGGDDWGTEYFAPDTSYEFDNYGSEYFMPDQEYGQEYFAPDNIYGEEYFAPDQEYGTEYFASDSPVYSSSPSYGYGGSYGGGSYGCSSCGGFRSISYPSAPVTFRAPSYVPPAPVIAPPSSIINTNTNTNVNNITNNNNSSAIAIATSAPAPQAPVPYVQPPLPAPSCIITITNGNNTNYGPSTQVATLTWSSMNATSAYISPNVGNVSPFGSMQVYPTSGQVYTMTVYGQGGTAYCTAQPFYAPVVSIQNPTPYVSLSQIPYTGLELSTLGNVMYWLSLVTFAGAAAYLLLYFNGGALAVLGARRSQTQIAMPKITVSHPVVTTPAKAVVEAKPEPVLSPIQLQKAPAKPATVDTMKVAIKEGETPRIIISRE